MFAQHQVRYDILHRRLQELAFLNRGTESRFKDDRTGHGETFHYDRGLLQFVEFLNRASDPAHSDIIYIAKELEGVGIEVAMQYTVEFTENVHTTSTISTPSTAARTSPAFAPP